MSDRGAGGEQSRAPLLVGIDIGTTNIKAIAVEPDGQVVAGASLPTPTHIPRPGWAYYEPAEIWETTVATLRRALGTIDPARVAGVAIASMGEAAVPIDRHGEPTYQAIAWFDRRTQPQADWLAQTIGKDTLFAISGLALLPIFGLCKLLWLKENEPEAFARTNRWLHMADYIAFQLSGAQATDYSLASRTLALDLRRRVWDINLLQTVGIPADILAPLTQSGTAIGRVTGEAAGATGLPVGACVAAGGHDHVCGAFGAGVVEPGMVLNSLGTAEALFLPLDAPIMNPQLGREGYTQGAHVVPDRYYVLGGLHASGASVEWIRTVVGEGIDYATLIQEASEAPLGSCGAVFLPHLRLSNPPFDDPLARGAFVGLTTDISRGAMMRAVFEGLAYDARQSLAPLLAHAGSSAREIIAIGGGTRNRLLLRLKATVLNRPIAVCEMEEGTTFGAALLAGIGSAVYPDFPAARRAVPAHDEIVEPDERQVEFYDRCFREVYAQLYQTLRPINHALATIL